ncbi:MAG: hypothetical protein ABFR05_02850 [Bacteroidota bacterium]
MLKKYSTHIKFILLFLLMAFLFGFAKIRNADKMINEIDMTFKNGENLFITYDSVNKLLIQKIEPLKKQLIDSLNLNSIEKAVQSNEMIKNIEVFYTSDGKLGAEITQRTPVLRVVEGFDSYYIDENGLKMPLSMNYSARVPITYGKSEVTEYMQIANFANKIREDSFLQKQIIGIEQEENKRVGQFRLKTRIGDQIIVFGNLQNFENKKNKLKVFYQKALKDSVLHRYDTINLMFKNQVVCTKK